MAFTSLGLYSVNARVVELYSIKKREKNLKRVTFTNFTLTVLEKFHFFINIIRWKFIFSFISNFFILHILNDIKQHIFLIFNNELANFYKFNGSHSSIYCDYYINTFSRQLK